MKDINSPKVLEISISTDGKKVWVNSESGCHFRAYEVKELIINDARCATVTTAS